MAENKKLQSDTVIIKNANRKLEEKMRGKKRISSKSFNHLNVPKKVFVSLSLCPYYRYIWGLVQRFAKTRPGESCFLYRRCSMYNVIREW